MRKTVAFFLICIILLLLLPACQNRPERVKVVSSDYTSLKYLEEGTFDKNQLQYWYHPDNPYFDYLMSVSISDGKLCISNQTAEEKCFLRQFDCGYFMGVDLGEFDGWVKYYPYYSMLPEAGEEVLIASQNCRGIIARDKRNGYLLTGEYFGWVGNLYEIHYSEENCRWEWSLLESFDGYPMAFSYQKDQDILYIVTSKSILSVSGNHNVSTVVESELLPYLDTNSIVYYDDSFWCGSTMGVYRYCVAEKEEKWYPRDYQSQVK